MKKSTYFCVSEKENLMQKGGSTNIMQNKDLKESRKALRSSFSEKEVSAMVRKEREKLSWTLRAIFGKSQVHVMQIKEKKQKNSEKALEWDLSEDEVNAMGINCKTVLP